MPKLKQSNMPRTERPQIPDYGISKNNTDLLPWKWAVKTLTESREDRDSTARWSAARHDYLGLLVRRCILVRHRQQDSKGTQFGKELKLYCGTQNAAEAVILEGEAERITEGAIRKKLERPSLRKYGISGGDGSEPLYRVRPTRVLYQVKGSLRT